MTKSTLLATSFAAMLMASPALAMTHGTTGQNDSANTGTNGPVYANIGNGGYDGAAAPLHNGNTNGNNGGNFNNGNNGNNQNNVASRPSQRNPLLADNGDVRASKMIGTDIYNGQNKQIGSVSDVLIGKNGVWAIIGGNNHQVAVPFREFEFGNTNVDGHDKLVLPNMTQAQLNNMPAFHYQATNYANNNNNNNNGGVFANNGRNGNGTGNGAGNGTGNANR